MTWLTILQNNFKRKLMKKTSFLVTLLIPIFVVVLGIAANMVSKPSFAIGIVDLEPTTKSEKAIETLKTTAGIEVENASPAIIKTDIITGYYSAVIEFSNDSFQINSVKDQQTIDVLSHLVETYLEQPTPIDIESLFGTSLGAAQRICAFIILFLMITATINASLITKDKNNGTLRRIKFSPCSAASYVAGNVLFNFAITYFQFFVAVSVIKLFQLDTGISYANFLIMGIWATLFTTAFGTCMASIFKMELQVNLFATCIAMILSLIGGTFIPLEKMPVMLQRISVISPVRWFIDNVNGMVQGRSWFSGTRSVIILSLFVLGLFIIAVARNKRMNTQ